MRYVTIDFESFYDSVQKYSLKNLTTVSYVRNEQFKAHGCAVKMDNADSVWMLPDQLTAFLATLNPADTTIIGHNLMFDAFVLVMHYKFIPARWCAQ